MLFLLFACATATDPTDTSTEAGDTSADTSDTSADTSGDTSDTSEQVDAPTFSKDVQPILEAKCAGCHYSEPEKLPLYGDAAYDLLVNHPAGQLPSMDRVEPGSLDESYLYQKLLGNQKKIGGKGEKMPSVYGEPLTADEQAVFKAWIEGGALH